MSDDDAKRILYATRASYWGGALRETGAAINAYTVFEATASLHNYWTGETATLHIEWIEDWEEEVKGVLH
jgi:hypothetical protein